MGGSNGFGRTSWMFTSLIDTSAFVGSGKEAILFYIQVPTVPKGFEIGETVVFVGSFNIPTGSFSGTIQVPSSVPMTVLYEP